MTLDISLEKLEGPVLDVYHCNLSPEAFGSAFHDIVGEINSHLIQVVSFYFMSFVLFYLDCLPLEANPVSTR